MQSEINTAIKAATAAGDLLKRHFHETFEVAYKGAIDPVTEYDFQAENLIADILQHDFPGYGIWGEEARRDFREDVPCWVVDPLDGTTNYSRGYPMFAVSIALQVERQISLGVVYNPILDELFLAERGRGATLNSQPIQVSGTRDLGHAVLASGFPYDIRQTQRDNLEQWAHLTRRIFSPRCDGCASLDLCYVACGRVDGYWELDLESWDMAAGALIAMEAGAVVTAVSGMPFDIFSRNVLASNPLIHPLLLEQLR